jgi:hypothetical protein
VWLIDCDSALLHGAAALTQLDPGHYKLRTPRPFDQASDYYKFATLTVRCLEEDNTVWDCRDERAMLLMRSVDLGLLRRALHETAHDDDPAHWQSLLRNWRLSVSKSGALSYRNDQFVKQEWPGVTVLGGQTPRRRNTTPVAPPEPQDSDAAVSTSTQRGMTVATAGALLVTVLAVVVIVLVVLGAI